MPQNMDLGLLPLRRGITICADILMTTKQKSMHIFHSMNAGTTP